ncbi:MAG: trypsin-like peptidase domain-containing protein, partial [Phycisphaerales bacterium]|nr:trypsin-like peptidase domain-containing protein [Phycisphaerales bacterium]
NDTVAPLLAQNLTPTFVRLTACFPGRAPTPIDPTTIRLSVEGVDIAILRVAPDAVSGIPALPLYAGDVGGFRGGRIILLGYPTGLNAVLARAEPDAVTEILSKVSDTDALLSALADRSLITPVITQGALNEVRDRRLVYDAETTSGGSGGPVFGPDGTVVGVNFAITRDFGGTNFGVPIKFARSLLEPAPTTP